MAVGAVRQFARFIRGSESPIEVTSVVERPCAGRLRPVISSRGGRRSTKRTVSPMTLANYRNVVKLYIVPAIGAKRVATLTPGDVSKMLQDMADAGKSANTQRLARSVLRRALRLAEQEGTVFRNVAAIAEGGAADGAQPAIATHVAVRDVADRWLDRFGPGGDAGLATALPTVLCELIAAPN